MGHKAIMEDIQSVLSGKTDTLDEAIEIILEDKTAKVMQDLKANIRGLHTTLSKMRLEMTSFSDPKDLEKYGEYVIKTGLTTNSSFAKNFLTDLMRSLGMKAGSFDLDFDDVDGKKQFIYSLNKKHR